jgi:TRAP-type mannitol/chloroaromatic compound transport system substrate-binding protein
MRRRDFTKLAVAGTVGTIAAPAVVTAQTTFNWRMTSFYGPNAAFYSTGPGSAKDLVRRIEEMSNGRIKIQFYGAGELIPAAEGFDAVSSGIVEMNYANAYFWTGKIFAGQYFTAVPFGLNFQGLNGWMYDGGGLALWREVYDRFNLVPFLCGNTGVQMTGWFKKPIEKPEDLKGLKMRIPGLAGRVYQQLGVDVRLLPPGEIFPALERGVIDAAEFVGPYLDRQLGLHRAAKFYYTTGWHETATSSELIINKAKWASLPADLKAIIENACAACNVISEAWCQKNNAEAMEDLIKNQGVTAAPLPDSVVKVLRESNEKVLAEAVARDPVTKKVHDSYMAYMEKYTNWASYSEAVYHSKILHKA